MSKNKHEQKSKKRMDKRSQETARLKKFYSSLDWGKPTQRPQTETTFISPYFAEVQND